MSYEPMNEQEKGRSSGRVIAIIVVVAVIFALVTAVAGYSFGRASVASQTTAAQTTAAPTEVAAEAVEAPMESEPAVESEAAAEPEAGDVASEGDTAVEDTAVEEPAASEPTIQGDPQAIDFDIFYEAWQLVEQQYDGDIPLNEDVLYSAIEGSMDTLDDEYTRFIRPDIAARLREDAGGAVEGIGAFVRETEEGFFEIVRPIPGQPAEKAGLLPGDIVIEVDGQSMEGVSFDEVIMLVRGPRGTDVTLTIAREGEEEPLEFTITRVRFEIPTVEYEMLENNIGYVHLQEFNQTATEKMTAALEDLFAQGATAIIFDLRDNPGGFLNQSVMVADMFLPEGVVLFERNRNGLDETFTSDDGDLAESIPLVVLVNGGSASASEIVAGAIRDNGRAILIGETSFGKGSVQQVHELSDGSELRVTIARWYTPANNTIDKTGIAPDIEVPMAFDAEEDIQLDRAIEYLLEGE